MGIPGRIEDAWDALMGKDRLRALKCAVYMHTSDTRDTRGLSDGGALLLLSYYHALAIASTFDWRCHCYCYAIALTILPLLCHAIAQAILALLCHAIAFTPDLLLQPLWRLRSHSPHPPSPRSNTSETRPPRVARKSTRETCQAQQHGHHNQHRPPLSLHLSPPPSLTAHHLISAVSHSPSKKVIKKTPIASITWGGVSSH